jgi:hypothetical protein
VLTTLGLAAELARDRTAPGEIVVSTDTPHAGTILPDRTPDQRYLRMSTDGEWSVAILPIAHMLEWGGHDSIDGEGDAVFVIPGGLRAP